MQSTGKTLLVTQCIVHFNKHQKIKFIAYIYIHFIQNLGEKSYISIKIEEVKHTHAVFQHENSVNDVIMSSTFNQIVESLALT